MFKCACLIFLVYIFEGFLTKIGLLWKSFFFSPNYFYHLISFVNRLVSIGNLEAAVSLLLSTPPESSYFYANALRAVALSSAVSKSLLELAVKVNERT